MTDVVRKQAQPDFNAKSTKIDFGWGSAPDPAGELTALPQIPSWI